MDQQRELFCMHIVYGVWSACSLYLKWCEKAYGRILVALFAIAVEQMTWFHHTTRCIALGLNLLSRETISRS